MRMHAECVTWLVRVNCFDAGSLGVAKAAWCGKTLLTGSAVRKGSVWRLRRKAAALHVGS